MRRIIASVALGLSLAAAVYAQQATLSAPITRTSEDNYRVESYTLTRDNGGQWFVIVSVRDSSGVEIRRVSYSGPDASRPGATAAAFNTAVSFTVLGGETGANTRKADFRVLTFLNTQGYLPAGVTLVP